MDLPKRRRPNFLYSVGVYCPPPFEASIASSIRPPCLYACSVSAWPPACFSLLLACSLSPHLAHLGPTLLPLSGGLIVRCPARGCALGEMEPCQAACVLAVVPGCAVVRLSHGPPHRLSGQPFICGCRDAAPISVLPLTPFIRLLVDGWALQGCSGPSRLPAPVLVLLSPS